MKARFLALAFALLSTACSTGAQTSFNAGSPQSHAGHLPWTISHLAPDHMEAYLNGIVVFDIRNRMNPSAVRGSPSMGRPAPGDEITVGWPSSPGWGSVTPVKLDLPKKLIISWRSFVDQHEYYAQIEIPEHARQQMKVSHRIECFKSDGPRDHYRNNLVVGIAPGGIVKLWLNGQCLDAVEIGRYEGERDASERKGYSSRPLSDKTKAYLRANPTLLDSF